MSIRVFRDTSSLCAQKALNLSTKAEKTVEEVARVSRMHRGGDDIIDIAVARESNLDNITLNITVANLIAADSTTREIDVAKDIAILTRNHILKTRLVGIKKI